MFLNLILPLTAEGSFLEAVSSAGVLHDTFQPMQNKTALTMFMPFGTLCFIHGNVMHAGGHRSANSAASHMRLHLCVLLHRGEELHGLQDDTPLDHTGSQREDSVSRFQNERV